MFNPKIISALAPLSTIVAVVVLVHHRGEPVRPVRPIGTPQTIATPLGLPPVPVPADNPLTVETVALGKRPAIRTEWGVDMSQDSRIPAIKLPKPERRFFNRGQASA